MDPTVVLLGTIALVAMGLVAVASALAARFSPTTAEWDAQQQEVLVVVSVDRWRRIMVRAAGVVVLVIGATIVWGAATTPDPQPEMGIVGTLAALMGASFLWLAHAMARMRIEITREAIWVSRSVRAPLRTRVQDITRLQVRPSGRYGGVAAKAGRRTLFTASTAMPGYRDLISYLEDERPDLFLAGGFR